VFFDLIGSKGLADVTFRTGRKRLHHVRLAAFRGDHDHWNSLGLGGLQVANKLQSIHHGHIDVAENEVNGTLFQNSERLRPIPSFTDPGEIDPRLTERAFDNLPHNRKIVHDERAYFFHMRFHLAGRRWDGAKRPRFRMLNAAANREIGISVQALYSAENEWRGARRKPRALGHAV
jgi:hypothetical protein